jgi:hypothetical protein
MYIFYLVSIYNLNLCEGKANPVQAWTGLEDFRRLRLPDFKRVGT